MKRHVQLMAVAMAMVIAAPAVAAPVAAAARDDRADRREERKERREDRQEPGIAGYRETEECQQARLVDIDYAQVAIA